jgi:hypothetical protein
MEKLFLRRSVILLAAILVLPSLTLGEEPTLTIPAGTTIETALGTLLTTKGSEEGDPFVAKVVEPIFNGGEQVVPAGSMLHGHVSFVRDPGRVKGKAQMRLVADKIVTNDNVEFVLSAGLQDAKGAEGAKVTGEEGTLQGPGKGVKGAATDAAVGAGVGAATGAIAAGGTGSLYGLGIGAVTGVIRNMARKHKDLILPMGTDLAFQVPRTVTGKKVAPSTDFVMH